MNIFSKIYWWIVGYLIAIIFYFGTVFSLHYEMEQIDKTNPNTTMEGLGVMMAWGICSLISIVIFLIFLSVSFVLHKKGIKQFPHKIIVYLMMVLFFIGGNYSLRYFFPVSYHTNLNACLQIANFVVRDSCINKNCNEKVECIYEYAVKLKSSELCGYIKNDSMNSCKCLYDTNLAGAESHLANFIAAKGDCNIYSNVNYKKKACFAIKNSDISICGSAKNPGSEGMEYSD